MHLHVFSIRNAVEHTNAKTYLSELQTRKNQNTITAPEVFLAVKTLKAAVCDEIRPETL